MARIRPPAPFSLSLMRRRMAFARATEFHLHGDGSVIAVLGGGTAPEVVRIRQVGDEPDNPGLEVTFYQPGPARQKEAMRRLRHTLAFDVDLEAFYGHITGDPALAPLARRFRGLRPVRTSDLFEAIVKTIIGQQLNMAFAGTLTRRLVALCGSSIEVDGIQLPVFPPPEAVARLSYEQLQAQQFSRRKAEYVIDFARLAASGAFDLEGLAGLDDEEAIRRLMGVRGLGRWSAECTLLFGLGRPDVLPAADIGLRNAVRQVYGLDAQPGEGEVRQLGEAWRPYRALATFYLWEALAAGISHPSRD